MLVSANAAQRRRRAPPARYAQCLLCASLLRAAPPCQRHTW